MIDRTQPDVDGALARLGETANRIADERNAYLRAGRQMLSALQQASAELEPRQDCDHDGPDWAMRLKTEVDAAIAAARAAGIKGN